jgi:hypothetical protein
VAKVCPEFSQLTWLSRIGPAISSCPIESVSLLCPQRKMARVLVRSGVLLEREDGEGHYLCNVQGSSKKKASNSSQPICSFYQLERVSTVISGAFNVMFSQ